MKKRLLSVAFLMGAMAANAQVGIGVKDPNLSAELTVSAPNRGLLIPNVKLTDTKDITTITNKNVESLLVYNIATVKDVTPGYYYWHINRWARLTADQDIPQIVVNKFEEILKMDGDKVTTLIKNLIKGNETLTVLAYNPTTGTLTYTDEKKQPTTVDIKAAVKSFETVTSIATDAVAGTITFKDEAGKSTVLNLKELVEAHETVTVLTRVAPGKYIYKNEAGTNKEINVIGDITEVIKNKTDQDLYNVLKNIVKVEETLTKLIYNAPQKQLTYTDEKAVAHNIDVEKLVQDNQIISELSAGKNISVTQVQNGNKITYTLDVPTATKDVPGVVKPGSGLDIDADGNLTVNLGSALNGKDLVGNNIIVVTDGTGAVLKETKLSVNEKEIKLENLGGTLNLTQLQNGKAGDVLVVNENGEVEWSAKEAITTNKLELVGSELVSTVNGVGSKQTLEDKLTTEMLQNKSVTAEKLGATPAEQGKVPVVQKDGSVVYGNVSSDNVDGKALKSANDLMTVSLEAGVVLKDVTLTVNQGNFDLAQIGGTLKLTQLEKGKDGEVLVTDKDGTVKWVKGDNQVIKEMVKANETVTTLVDNGNGTFTYHNEDDYDVDGKLIPGKDGITFNANTLEIEVADGVYTFIDGNGELAKIDTKAKASSYDNSNSGLKSENVQDAIDELIKKVGVVANTKGSLTSTDITVGNGTDALLKDVTLAIADGAVTTDKIKDGAVTTEKIKAGKDGEVLVTVTENGTEITKWVPKDTVVKSVETVTQLVENANGTFTYYNESQIGEDGKPKADAKGVEIDPALVNVEKQGDSYVFTDSKGTTIATIKFAAGDISYTNTKLGDTTTVGGAIDKLVERIEAIEAKRADLSTDGIILVNDSDKLAKSVLEAATLSIKAGGITEKELGENSVTTEKIKAGKDGEVLVTVTENGTEITKWVPKKDATSNELELDGNKLVSTVNGKEASVDLTDKISNEMLKDGSVSADKMTSFTEGNGTTNPVEKGAVPVADGKGGVSYEKVSGETLNGNALTSGSIKVFGGEKALLDATIIEVLGGEKDGQVLVTKTKEIVVGKNSDGTDKKETHKVTEWVDASDLGNTVIVSNGLTKNGNEIELGGDLTKPTVIKATEANSLAIEGMKDLGDKVDSTSDKLVVAGKDGVLKQTSIKDIIGDAIDNGANGGEEIKAKALKGDGITVTAGDIAGTDSAVANSLLKDVTLGIAENAITSDKIKDGAVTTDKIEAGKDGEVLVTVKDDKGNAVTKWVPKDATSNELKLDGNTLVSTVNGVESNVDLTDKISKEMLKEGSVTKEKINKDVAGEGLTKNENTGALDVDFDKVKEELAKGNVTSKTIVVTGGDKSTFKNVELEIKAGENAGDVLVTSKDPLKDDKGEVVKDENGKPVYKTEWITKKEATTNELKLDGNKLISTVNGKEASVELTDANIASTKGIKGEGITVVGGENSTLKDVTLSITAGEKEGDVLVTKVDGEGNKTTEWKTPEVVATTNELSSTENTMTSNVNGISKSAKIINSVENSLDNDNKLVTTVNGVPGEGLDLTQAIVAGQEKTEVAAGHAVTVTSNTIGKTTTYTVAVKDAEVNATATELDGDVTGTAGANTISQLQGNPIDAKNPAGGNVLVFEGGKWINKTPVIDAGNVTNGKALTSGQNTISITGEGSTALLKDVQIDVANGAITSDKLGKDAVTSDKIKDGAVTPGKLEAGKDGEVLTTTETKDSEGKTITTVEWKKPVIEAGDVTKGGNLTSKSENLLTVTNGNGTVLQNVSLTVNESAFDISNMKGNLTVNRLEAGNEGQVLETVKEGENEVVKWVDKSKPTVVNGGNSTTSNVIVTPGTNGKENEYTVDVKAAMPKVFYMPPVMFDTSKTGTGKTRNLYEEYKAMFTGTGAVVETPIVGDRPAMVKSDVNATIPVFAASELDFFVPYYDPAVFANVKIDATGKLTYDIIKKAKYGAFMTVVFVVNNK
ncbi:MULTISPECIES: hypothetical protein [unclassified Myroides]|uniref:hypothetical protein n=1 Tax=unclassified Myroides TaxID=2642485 RepID=UPI0031019D95